MVHYVRRQLQKARDTGGRERGATLLWVATMLVLLLGASAFAVDLGWIFLNGSRLQRAADSASLAGVVNLPVSPSGALADATDAAGRNGFPIVLNGPTSLTPSVLADNRYKVDMTTTIDTFFLRALGFAEFEIFKTATAEYIKPVRLGSPDNSFGNGTSDNFWAAINGRYTEKEQGDPYATQCITTPDDDGAARCNPGMSDVNQEFRDWGYFYVIEIAAGASNLNVELFEPGHAVGDDGGTISDTGDLAWRSNWTQHFITTTFNLHRPDQTPFAPFDNPLECTESFPRISSPGQGWLTLCPGSISVPGAVEPGMWLLNIPSPLYEGSSKFGIRATVDGGSVPKVYGLFDMSIYVNIDGGEASPYLAEVRPEHEGKTFELDIFDMGDNDGNAWIEILEPDGSVTQCSWEADNGESAPLGNCHVDISNRRFNADWLNLTIPLDGYSCDITQPLGCWWKIRIHNEGQAHDRTTWTARITGNPLRLVP
jgi:hypothetical protein